MVGLGFSDKRADPDPVDHIHNGKFNLRRLSTCQPAAWSDFTTTTGRDGFLSISE